MYVRKDLWCKMLFLALALVLTIPALSACSIGGSGTSATTASVAATMAASETEIYSNNNIAAVINNPTGGPTTVTVTGNYKVTLITDYHWNNGQGSPAGTIGLKDSSGKVIGTWPVTVRSGVYWDVKPNTVIGPGTYTVVDSDAATWAQNSQSGNKGITDVKGLAISYAGAAAPAQTSAQSSIPAANVLVSQDISPSSTVQTVAWKDQVKVSIPAGLVTAKQSLTIAAAPAPPPPGFPGLASLVSYDVSMGDTHEFNKDLTVEIAYDPSKISSDLPAAKALVAKSWDPAQNLWMTERSVVDTKRNVVVIRTNHLSVKQIDYIPKGWTTNETEHFIVVYNPKETGDINQASTSRKGQTVTVSTPLKKLAEDIGTDLEHAWGIYGSDQYKFLMPIGDPNEDGKLWVFLDPTVTVSQRANLSGDIYLSTKWTDTQYADSAAQLRHETAHELFHSVQNRYFHYPQMWARKWFMEATADYAADAIAWGGAGTMPLVPANYFSKPIDTSDGSHEYKTSRFVAYLSQPAGSFKQMWDYVAGQSSNVLYFIDDYLTKQRKSSLENEYRNFAAFVLFDAKGPLSPTLLDAEAEKPVLDNGLLNSPAVLKADILDASKTALNYTFPSLDQYTASVWGIRVQPLAGQQQRNIRIERTNITGLLYTNQVLNVYILKNDVRPDGGVKPEGSITVTSPKLDLRPLDKDDIIYVVDTNAGEQTGSIDLKVGDSLKSVDKSVEGFINNKPFNNNTTWMGTADNPVGVRLTGSITGDPGLKFEGTEWISKYADWSNILSFVYSIPANATITSLDFDNVVIEGIDPPTKSVQKTWTYTINPSNLQTFDETGTFTYKGWSGSSWSGGPLKKGSGYPVLQGWTMGKPLTLKNCVLLDPNRNGEGTTWAQSGAVWFDVGFDGDLFYNIQERRPGIPPVKGNRPEGIGQKILIRLVKR